MTTVMQHDTRVKTGIRDGMHFLTFPTSTSNMPGRPTWESVRGERTNMPISGNDARVSSSDGGPLNKLKTVLFDVQTTQSLNTMVSHDPLVSRATYWLLSLSMASRGLEVDRIRLCRSSTESMYIVVDVIVSQELDHNWKDLASALEREFDRKYPMLHDRLELVTWPMAHTGD